MRVWGGRLLIAFLIMAMASACGRNRDRGLLSVDSTIKGPDEFAILPNKPLQMPDSYTELPPPGGGVNRGGVTPRADVISALGGNPDAVPRGIPAGDAGLVAHASRHGRQSGIRAQLAAEDVKFRRRNNGRLLERAFNKNLYFRVYGGQSLNQYAELERFRRLGVRTPAVPPRPEENL